MVIVTARDQLDFSKLLLWKLLLSISSLDDALDANYYAEWDLNYANKRSSDSYSNTHTTIISRGKDRRDLRRLPKRKSFRAFRAQHTLNEPNQRGGQTKAAAKTATNAVINKHLSPEVVAAAKAYGEVAKHHAKDLHSKGKARLAKVQNSSHVSGADFQKKQNISNNLIYLEKAIDDGATESSASTVMFNGPEYNKYEHQQEFISSLENKLQTPLVVIVNKFYDKLDPLTRTYLNKLIATSIPLIDRIKLYIFLASLIPEFGKQFAEFLKSMTPNLLNLYTTELNHNMHGLFYKHREKLQTKRDTSILKAQKRKKMLKDGIKMRIQNINPTPKQRQPQNNPNPVVS